MLRDSISSVITPFLSLLPSGRDVFSQRVWQSQGPAPCICLRYQKVETNLWKYKETSWESVPKAGWQFSSCSSGFGVFEHWWALLAQVEAFHPDCFSRGLIGICADLCWFAASDKYLTPFLGAAFALEGRRLRGMWSRFTKSQRQGARWRRSWFSPEPTTIKWMK